MSCIICNWTQKEYLTWTDHFGKTTKKLYTLIKCEKCGLEQISPTPSFDEIVWFYNANYYSYQDSALSKIEKIRDTIFNSLYTLLGVNKKDFDIHKYPIWAWKTFLDIWCAPWNIVREMAAKWYIAEWFEIWQENQKKWNIYYADSIVNVQFDQKYDLIYMSHVFEHIDNPIEFLAKITEILKDDWSFLILLPNIHCISSKVFGKYALERDIPRHLFNYNLKNLTLLFENNWFIVKNKSLLKSYWLFDSYRNILDAKYNITIWNSIIAKIARMFTTLVIENMLNLCKSTNQMWFLVSKKS